MTPSLLTTGTPTSVAKGQSPSSPQAVWLFAAELLGWKLLSPLTLHLYFIP